MFKEYEFNPHSVPVLIAAFAALTLGLILRSKKREEEVSSHFLALCSGIFVWLFCTAMALFSIDKNLALWWLHLDNAGVMFISPSFYAFSMRLTRAKQRLPIYAGYCIATIFAILSVTANFPAVDATKYWWGYFPRWSVIKSIPFFTFFFGFMLAAFMRLRASMKENLRANERIQVRYVLVAFVIAYFGSVDYLPTFGYSFYPFGYIPIICLVSIIFYAVLKHRLMNIDLILRDTTVHAITASVVAIAAFVCVFPLVGVSSYAAAVVGIGLTIALMMFAYNPIRSIVQPAIDRVVFANQFGYLEELSQLPNDILEFTNLSEMLKFLVTRLKEAAKLERVRIFMYDPGHQSYVETMGQVEEGDGNKEEPRQLAETDPLVKLLRSNGRLWTQEDFYGQAEHHGVQEELKSLQGAACFPVKKEQDLLGVVVLGKKRSGELFNQQDTKILQALRVRLENFLGQAMVITQEALNMVKDSHDMKNDVNALKGRITWRAMKIASWKMDFEKDTQALEGQNDIEHLRAALHSFKTKAMEWFADAERSRGIEDQSVQRLAHRLRNWAEYGRVISEGFRGSRTMEAIEVGQAAKISVERWLPHAEKKGLTLSAQAAPNLLVWGERSLVEQIIENLIDNAIKATEQGKVEVLCKADRSGILLEVKDSGCGIPPEDLTTIFEKPFYQGKGRENLEQSTGVGLYLVAQYTRSLGGKVWAESQVGKGSSFFVQLPKYNQEHSGVAA
jgi:signal transduction histidine kinase